MPLAPQTPCLGPATRIRRAFLTFIAGAGLALVMTGLSGCGGGGAGDEGTVDAVAAQKKLEAGGAVDPGIAKAAAKRGGGMGNIEKKSRGR